MQCRVIAWLVLLALRVSSDSGANQATPSYEQLLAAVKSGTFEVVKKPQLPDPKSELEDILFKSKILILLYLRIKIIPVLLGFTISSTICKDKIRKPNSDYVGLKTKKHRTVL